MNSTQNHGTDKIDVTYVARLARLNLDKKETNLFQRQLEDIVGYVQKVRELDVAGVEPTAHGIPVQNIFREDEAKESTLHDKALANAPAVRDGQFQVPKIVE